MQENRCLVTPWGRPKRSIPAATPLQLLGVNKLDRVDFELEHLGGVSAVVAPFALHGDATDLQVPRFGQFHRAIAVELDGLG